MGYYDRAVSGALLIVVVISLCSGCSVTNSTYKRTPLDPGELFDRAAAIIEKNYIDRSGNPIKIDAGVRPDLDKLIKQTDPSSVYYNAEDSEIEVKGYRGGGVGIIFKTIQDRYPEIVGTIPGSPARKAGLRHGERLIRIDEASTEGMTTSGVVRLLRGAKGSEVRISVAGRAGGERTISMTREAINLRQKPAVMIGGSSIGYLRIESFLPDTLAVMRKDARRLNKEQAKGLIVDIRNNSGGMLTAVTDAAGYFLKYDAVICTIGGRKDGESKVFRSDSSDYDKDLPLVVLINSKTSSGAEILAAAWADHKRALLVGERTEGIADIQTLFPLGDGSHLRLRTALVYRPNGGLIEGNGVEPDRAVYMTEQARARIYDRIETDIDGYRGDDKLDAQLNAAIEILTGFDAKP